MKPSNMLLLQTSNKALISAFRPPEQSFEKFNGLTFGGFTGNTTSGSEKKVASSFFSYYAGAGYAFEIVRIRRRTAFTTSTSQQNFDFFLRQIGISFLKRFATCRVVRFVKIPRVRVRATVTTFVAFFYRHEIFAVCRGCTISKLRQICSLWVFYPAESHFPKNCQKMRSLQINNPNSPKLII